jgi:arsenate reductase (glutaredoxin)
MITMYGIRNCDTIKKARAWLEENKIGYIFHDYKKEGIYQSQLLQWCDEIDFNELLNRRGTTWRKLSDPEKEDVDQAKAISIMLNNTSIIKRPILVTPKHLIVGFNLDQYKSLL